MESLITLAMNVVTLSLPFFVLSILVLSIFIRIHIYIYRNRTWMSYDLEVVH